jgi:hypothetical protein
MDLPVMDEKEEQRAQVSSGVLTRRRRQAPGGY